MIDKSKLAKAAYEGYCIATGWKSLATGDRLPEWPMLKPEIRAAWEAAVGRLFITGSDGKDYLYVSGDTGYALTTVEIPG